ncbi:MAG: glycerol-3-phosphate 1-O-acyltransferase PlsY [Rikenellaceae bacterium]
MVLNILLVIVAYLLGSIPSAVWIGKKYYGVDVREHGSKNAGATNTLRVLGKKAALPVFLVDFFKGFVAVELGFFSTYYFDGNTEALFYYKLALSVAVVVGHMLPVFAGFKGGKGVATTAGLMLALQPFPLLLSLVIVFIITRYVSLSSIIGAAFFPIYIAFVFHGATNEIVFGAVVAILLIFTHRKNIKRLAHGTESKTTFKSHQ